MFYTFEEEQFSELDLFEEAASVVSVGPNQESALQACISLSSPTIANYHAKREQSKPHDRDPEKYFKETGYSALLQYVISSKGAHSEVIVPLCLECLDLLQVIVNEEVAGFEDYALIETFVDQTAHRLLTVAELSQNVRKEILDVIWGWATGFVELVIRNQSAWKFQCGLAGLAGVLAALIKSRADFQRSYMVTLTEITAALLDFGPFKFLHGEGEPHYSAWSASGGFERAVYKVFHNLFEFGKILLLSMLEIDGQKSATQSAQWEGLLDAESRISTANGEEQVAIRTLYGLCWRLYSHRTANLEADDVQAEEIKTLLPAVVKCGILCTMHVDDLKQNLLGHVSGILTKHNAFFSPALVITCLESLTLVIDHVPALKPTVIETLLSFICLPSPVFLEWHHDSNSCAALRQCVGYLLLQNLKGTDGKDAIISVKAKCITIMSGQPLDGDGKKGWLTPQQKKMAQVNCTVAVATISVLLSEEETVDVVKRGFEGPLGDPSFKDHDVFWDSLGNIGLNSGVQLLSSIYGLYKKHRTVKSTRIRQILAREAAKSADSAATFLEDTLKAFTECASGMREKDASALKDLYDHAWVASILCEDVEFHKRDQNIVETNFIFRDFWLCAIARLLGQDGKWPAGWAGILQAIALKTPCFALSSQERFLEEDLRTQSVMEKIVGAEVQQRVRTCLQTAFTERYSASKTLSFAKCTYLLAVREVERFKAKNLAPLTILKYLNHDRLYNDEVYDFLLSIGDDVIGVFIRACSLKKDVPPPLIADQLKQLLFMAASRLERARAFAANSVYRILRAFPALVWHRKSVGLMLDLLQCLDTESQPSATRTETLRGKIGRKLDLLNEYDVQAASQDFFDFCVRWTKLAFQRSASETVGLIQGYMVDIQTNFPELAIGEKSQLVTLLGRFCSSEDIAAMIIKSVGKHALYYGEVRGMLKAGYQTGRDQKAVQERVAKDLCRELRSVVSAPKHPQFALNLHPALHRAAAMALLMDGGEDELLELICWTPITVFTPAVMDMAISVWSLLMSARAELGARVMGYLVAVWETTAMERKGLYRTMTRSANPFYSKMTYTPSKPSQDTLSDSQALSIHLSWIRFLLDRFKSARVQSVDHVKFFCKLYYIAHEHATSIKRTWFNREAYFSLVTLGAQIAEHLSGNGDPAGYIMWSNVVEDALRWFSGPSVYGQVDRNELDVIINFHTLIKGMNVNGSKPTVLEVPSARYMKIAWLTPSPSGRVQLIDAKNLLVLMLENEIHRLAAWLNPLNDKRERVSDVPPTIDYGTNYLQTLRHAWAIDPHVALEFGSRFKGVDSIEPALTALIYSSPASVLDSPEALPFILVNAEKPTLDPQLRYLLHWTAVPPITAVSLLGQQYKMHPWILQYAVRVLEHFPVEHVFFYIPQMVQALRYDTVGYIEHFILSAARTSQLFAHQIIWNMNANMYKFDKEGQADAPDSLKPTLERVQSKIIASLSGNDKNFFEREISFFSEVTGISGKLKPLVERGATKAEKKAKIDEEMDKVKVDVGVYLPTNPEGIILDIDKKSGRPLQSHAKAPFMATFQVASVDEENDDSTPADTSNDNGASKELTPAATRWMSAIFKVGDDCRQDVLALQLISIFKSIFSKSGLDLYVFPYRVVATAPGCGVIEVIPKSVSRDMMGREQVNSLYEWFIRSFGKEDSVSFRQAQTEFIKSLAAYSVIMFLLQFKDRHNGNIMFDDDGHVVHIDFGFMLSIAPGGGILEPAPFKLTHEMVQVLGGDAHTPKYRLFSQLVVKAYLACRPYAEEIVQMVSLMMDSGLPCFRGDMTIRKLRERFLPGKTERQAADFMVSCIRTSHENTRSGLYDRFQYIQNGIPY